MNRDNVKEVFMFLKEVYPQFEVTSSKLDTWTRLLKNQNPAVIMKNAEQHAMEKKFPPSIADIREKKKEAHQKDFLDKIKQWERDASGGK